LQQLVKSKREKLSIENINKIAKVLELREENVISSALKNTVFTFI